MQTQDQPKLQFHGISLLRVNLIALKPAEGHQTIDLNVDAKLLPIEEGSQEFRIFMSIAAKVPDCWEIEVDGMGDFEIQDGTSESARDSLININAPAIMFPYFRAFISTLTAHCGGTIPLLVIPPQFFDGELEVLEEQQQ